MPADYIEFDEKLRVEAARGKLSREAFIDRVNGYAVELVRFVCSYDGLCTCTRTIIGGFHICVFFDITSGIETKRWVLRIPMPVKHGGDLMNEKFRSEVATLKYLSANTCIPIPRLISYGLSAGPHPGGDNFMIMEYAEGRHAVRDLTQISEWSDIQRETFYSSLSDVLLELWSHTFPRIGSIVLRDDGEPDYTNLTRPLLLEFNNLELDGTDVSTVIPPSQTFRTATQYFDSLADLHMKRLLEQRNSIETEEEADLKFMNRIYFKNSISSFVDSRWDSGPFVLVLGDLSPQNILVDDEGAILAILDLEYTSIRPVQCIGPPVWLSGLECGDIIVQDVDELKGFAVRYEQFINLFERQEVVRFRSRNLPAHPRIRFSDIMKSGLESGRYWFAEASGSFYGFDGLFRWALVRHIPHHEDSIMKIVASWIGKRKLEKLHAVESSENANHCHGNDSALDVNAFTIADTSSRCSWPYFSMGFVSLVVLYVSITHRVKIVREWGW